MRPYRATDEQLRTLIDNLGDAVVLLDAVGHVLTWNPAAERAFGHTVAQALTLTLADLQAADGHAGDELARAAARGGFEHAGWRRHRDGRRIWTSSVLRAIRDHEGQLTGFALIMRDETALHEAEEKLAMRTRELEHSNAELEAFAALASHDLQEPLRKVRMFADRQRRYAQAMPADALALTDRIEAAAARMQGLIDSLLGYATMSRRSRPPVRVDLETIVRLVEADLEPRLAACGGRIEAGPLPSIEGDPAQLQRLIQNLIGNGLKFRRPGVAPVVTVSAEPTASGAWTIRVADNGIGFDPKHRERIFGLLQRLHGRHEYEGTGMGLAICRRIVECHDGEIFADGRPGEGSVFTVTLPAAARKVGHG